MYKILNTIKDVRGVNTNSNHEIIGYFNKELFISNKKVASNVDTTTASLRVFKSFLFFDIDDTTLIYDLEKGTLFNYNGLRYYPNSLENNEIFCVFDTNYSSNRFSWKTGLFSFVQGRIIKEFDFLKDMSIAYFLNINNVVVYKGANKLSSLSLLTGEYEWELDLGAYEEIDKIIGVCNDILWIGVGSKMLIGIDIKYGKIIHIIDKPSHFAYQSEAFNYFRGHDGQIDEKAKKIVGFEFDTYYELDLVTMEFTYWIFREEAKAMKIEARYASQNIHLEDFIYFIDKLNFKIGIFDRKNKTIKEAYVFPENSCTGFLNDLQVTNDKMYVLDTAGTLHIFEKERA